MEHELNFWVAGGDLRQAQLARLLAEDGHTVHTWALEEAPLPGLDHQRGLDGIERADCVVLPLPMSAGAGLLNAPLSAREHSLEGLLDRLFPGQVLCGGRVDPDCAALAGARGLTVQDYFAGRSWRWPTRCPPPRGQSSWPWSTCPSPSTAPGPWCWASAGWAG